MHVIKMKRFDNLNENKEIADTSVRFRTIMVSVPSPNKMIKTDQNHTVVVYGDEGEIDSANRIDANFDLNLADFLPANARANAVITPNGCFICITRNHGWRMHYYQSKL